MQGIKGITIAISALTLGFAVAACAAGPSADWGIDQAVELDNYAHEDGSAVYLYQDGALLPIKLDSVRNMFTTPQLTCSKDRCFYDMYIQLLGKMPICVGQLDYWPKSGSRLIVTPNPSSGYSLTIAGAVYSYKIAINKI